MSISELIQVLKEKLDILYDPVKAVSEIVIIFILASIISRIGSFLIRKFFEKQKSFKYKLDDKRIATMSTLSVSIFKYLVYIMVVVAMLSKLADVFNLQSVMTAAGIGGVALGLGAQSLIKDVISGFFIIMENQFVVGDLVTIEGMTGTIEEMELRVTKVRNYNGDLYIIPNGEIKKITNHVRDFKAIIVDIPVAYSQNIDKVFRSCQKVCDDVVKEYNTIIEAPVVQGITQLDKESLNVRIFAKCMPNEQWAIERRIRRLVKEEFENAEIEFFEKYKIVDRKDAVEGGNTDG